MVNKKLAERVYIRINDAEKKLENTINQALSKKTIKMKDIYISYSWSDEQIVNEIDNEFQCQGIELKRDKREATYKANLKEFMQKIGRSESVILVVSDKYLKSRNCMYEVLELIKNEDFNSRIFPIVLPDAVKIYEAAEAISYIQFWDDRISLLNNSLKKLGNVSNTGRIYEEINHCTNIRTNIDDFINIIQNMNTLNYDTLKAENFKSIIDLI